ncbi:MAG: hypothetical protein P1U68_11070 [Verrucomicrobiales bacterium]|nr:hypothetical protein [Verrucomicrobiales bacterium]
MNSATPPPIDPSLTPPQEVKWPKTLGIIALVIGILGLLQVAVAPISLIFLKQQMAILVEQGVNEEKVETFMTAMKATTIQSAIALGAIAILLTVGGVLLLKRKPLSAAIISVWAILKILIGGYFSMRSLSMTKMQLDITMSMGDVQGKDAEMISRITEYATYAGAVFAILWIAALPVFFLIWFNRQPVKNEIKTW